MKRVIITPPALAPAALDELKDWLAITTAAEDTFLTGLLRAALETCEAVTGQIPLAAEDYLVDLDAEGGAHVRLLRQGAAGRIAVRFVAGLAPDWASLPESLRHGIVRLAADAYRERNAGEPAAPPRAAIAALWRPWRRMRLA